VAFKVGYLMGEPVQYVNRGKNESASDVINQLNEYVFAEDKAAKDKDLATWFTIAGTSYRMALPDRGEDSDEAPFEIYTLDPRNTYVVYYSGLGHKPIMSVSYVINKKRGIVYSVYTDKMYYEIVDGQIVDKKPHILGMIPVIEYPANEARLGAFEIVLPLLDAINDVASNRMDGIEQFVQALLMFKGVDISGEDFERLKQKGGIKVPADGDVKYLIQELNQAQTQTVVDDMYETVLTICGMPNRNGGSSTSDTGSAVIMRDGWSAAEARAKDTEIEFKKSEKSFLKLILKITEDIKQLKIGLSDIEIRFTRRNYENIQAKSQVLVTMLGNSNIHPRLAFEHCGMFVDPEVAYAMSMEYANEQQKKTISELEELNMEESAEETTEDVTNASEEDNTNENQV